MKFSLFSKARRALPIRQSTRSEQIVAQLAILVTTLLIGIVVGVALGLTIASSSYGCTPCRQHQSSAADL